MKKKTKRFLPRPFVMPWGEGEIIEEASIKTKWHEPAIQLMKYKNGSTSIRFAHYRRSSFQRSPLIIDSKDALKLKRAISKSPELLKFFKKLVK